MGHKSAFFFCVLFLLNTFTIQTSSQYNTTVVVADSYNLTTSEVLPTEQPATNGNWVYAMFVSSILGILLTSAMGGHAIYHLFKEHLSAKCQRICYTLFFVLYWLVCISYAFFKTDMVISGMGTSIDCRVGYYLGTTTVYGAKLFLFVTFILRIDTAFHASALGYKRIFLGTLVIAFAAVEAGLYGWYILESWDIIEYVIDTNLIFEVGICTLGTEITTAHSILALLFIFDTIFSIIVCALFVYKLNKVVKMTGGHKKDKKKKNGHTQNGQSSPGGTRSSSYKGGVDEKNNKLLTLMKKQTMLVILAILTSFMILGIGAIYNPISLMIPLDAVANVFCVWLMFSFANNIWNKLIGVCFFCCCFCCKCCGDEDEWFQRHTTFSRSLRKRVSSFRDMSITQTHSSSTRDGRTTKDSKPSNADLPPISERNSVKNKDIEIKFDNRIDSSDLHPNFREKNKNKGQDKNDDKSDVSNDGNKNKNTKTETEKVRANIDLEMEVIYSSEEEDGDEEDVTKTPDCETHQKQKQEQNQDVPSKVPADGSNSRVHLVANSIETHSMSDEDDE